VFFVCKFILLPYSFQEKMKNKACESEKIYCVLQTFQEIVVSLWTESNDIQNGNLKYDQRTTNGYGSYYQ